MGMTVTLSRVSRFEREGSAYYCCRTAHGEEFEVEEVCYSDGNMLANYRDSSGKWHPVELSPNRDDTCDFTYRELGEITWTVGYGRDAVSWTSYGKPPRGEPGCVWRSYRPDPENRQPETLREEAGVAVDASRKVVASAIVEGLKRLAAEAEADGPVVIRLRLLASFLRWSTSPDDIGIGEMIARHAAQAKHYGSATWADYMAKREAELAARLRSGNPLPQRPTAPPGEEEQLSNPWW